MKSLLILGLLLCVIGCGESREDGAEYQRMAHDHMKRLIEDPDIDYIKVDGSVLYINFIKPQPESEYLLVATGNAVRFSNFRKSQLGVSRVTVYVKYKDRIVAEAHASGGGVTSAKSR